jgi:hypothetical protein
VVVRLRGGAATARRRHIRLSSARAVVRNTKTSACGSTFLSYIRIDAKRQALDALDAARRSAGPSGNGDGDSSKGEEEAPDEGGIDAFDRGVRRAHGTVTSQSAVERVSASR